MELSNLRRAIEALQTVQTDLPCYLTSLPAIDCQKALDELTTIERSKHVLKHGRMVYTSDPYDDATISTCSVCGAKRFGKRKYRYCPDCGARLDER